MSQDQKTSTRKTYKPEKEMAQLRRRFAPLLGKLHDTEIAERAGVCKPTVRKWRREAKIPPKIKGGPGAKPKHWTPERDKLLGTMTDEKLAAQLGIAEGTVRSRRAALKISSCKLRNRPRGANLIPIDGQKVRARRLALKLTYRQANSGNLSRESHLAKIESGLFSTVEKRTMDWLCEALQCAPGDLQ